MKNKLAWSMSAALVLAFSSPVSALQQSNAPLVIGQPDPQASNTLKQGTEVMVATLEELNSKTSRVGDRVRMEVIEAVSLHGQVVIPAGTPAVGEVTLVKKKGMWGKSGKLEFKPLFIKMGDRQIRISANAIRDKGKAGTAGVVASVAFLPLAGFLVTGTSANIPPHTNVAAQLDEDLPIVFAAPVAPQPLVVPGATTAAAPAKPSGDVVPAVAAGPKPH
jgi:hypothetical protein